MSDDTERLLMVAIREADAAYEKTGATGTKTWVREFLQPALTRHGLRVCSEAPPEPMQWKPIETAPRDGRDVVVGYDSASVWIVRSAWYRGPEVIAQQPEQFDVPDIGWWSYINSVTQERLWGNREPTHWLCEVDREHQN